MLTLLIYRFLFLFFQIFLLIWLCQVLAVTHRILVVACELLVMAYGIYLPNQGPNLGPLHWEHWTLDNQRSIVTQFLT